MKITNAEESKWKIFYLKGQCLSFLLCVYKKTDLQSQIELNFNSLDPGESMTQSYCLISLSITYHVGLYLLKKRAVFIVSSVYKCII